MRTGYSYTRFSTPEQAQGDSYRRQHEMAQRYAASHDIELDDSLDLRDLGMSAFRGANAKSGKLGLFRHAVDTGKVKAGSVLLVESLDRLSRMEPASSLNQVIQLLDKGISIVEVANQKEYTRENISELGNSMESFLRMALAHEESRKKSDRIAAAWANKRTKAQSGSIFTSNLPRWLSVVADKIIPIADRVRLVQRMFQMSLSGIGADLIAKTFNREGVANWGRGHGWHMSSVRKILHHRGLIGEFTPTKLVDGKYVGQEPIVNYYPKVIDEAVFYAVQAGITSRTKKGGRAVERVNLFTHIIKCMRCGSPLYSVYRGAVNKHRASFVCDWGRRAYNGSDCGWKPWLIAEVEAKVLKCVREIDLSSVLGDENSERVAALHQQLVGSRGKLADVEGRLSRVIELWEQGVHVSSVAERINKLEAERQALSDRCAVIEKEYDLQREAMDTAESKQRSVIELMNVIHDREVRLKLKQQLRELVERIDVDLVKKQIVVFYIGQRPRMMPITPATSPPMFKLQRGRG